MTEEIAKGVCLYPKDAMYALREIDANLIDSCVTDPPYELKFMGKGWDGTGIAFQPEVWRRIFRVLKPGAHLLAFGGTRTYHRMVCAIEDAGFEIRDQIGWAFGSGFPKSHDVSKGIDKANGDVRPVTGSKSVSRVMDGSDLVGGHVRAGEIDVTSAASAAWNGWGTALKPAWEPIVLARKPLIGTVAENVLKHRTGGLNIDGCRVEAQDGVPKFTHRREDSLNCYGDGKNGSNRTGEIDRSTGRWPANIIHDGSEEVLAAFPDVTSGNLKPGHATGKNPWVESSRPPFEKEWGGDSGSAARFFYTAKADSDERIGSKHPTVKPLDLMCWLVRLVTPPGGLVLDPFAGTGTTGEAAFIEGMRAVLIEREAEYQEDIRRRMKLAMAGPDERARESIKAAGKVAGAGPLFEGF